MERFDLIHVAVETCSLNKIDLFWSLTCRFHPFIYTALFGPRSGYETSTDDTGGTDGGKQTNPRCMWVGSVPSIRSSEHLLYYVR